MSSLTLAVLSDLHAYLGDERNNGSLLGYGSTALEQRNPLISLIKFVQKNQISTNVLVCAGDICNQADIGGFSHAWDHLHELQKVLGASCLVATCGNHDLNSRYLHNAKEDDPDPKGALLALDRKFPFDSDAQNNQFWAQNFAIADLSEHSQAVILNSSAYHGGDEEEITHGRVSRRTIQAIIRELNKRPSKPLNFLICHHHLIPMRELEMRTDYQYIKKGSELLEEIERHTRCSWLVIHGHRHHPRLINGPSASACAPIIFGSASLGARLTGISNQFHVISAEESRQAEHASIVGTVKTWSWNETTDWILSGRRVPGLPAFCGFGFKGQVRILATQVETMVGTSYVTWAEAISKLPSLKYLNPEDLNHLDEELSSRGISVISTGDGLPHQIAMTTV